MDVDRSAVFSMQSRGEADVIGVTMRQQYRTNVVERAAHAAELLLELPPLTGQAGVDEGQLAALFNQVAVDDVGADLMERGSELHE